MSGYDFDQLIKDGKTAEALRYFAKEGYDNGDFGHTRKQLVEHAADLAERVQELEGIKEAHIKELQDWLKDLRQLVSSKTNQQEIEYAKKRIDSLEFLMEQNQYYLEARKKIEEKYDVEYDIQNQEYMGGIADGLMIAMNIIDKALEGESG